MPLLKAKIIAYQPFLPRPVKIIYADVYLDAQHQVSFPKFRTARLNNQWGAFCQTNVSSGRGREVFTTVSAAVHQQQLTQNEEADAPLNHPPCQGGILALLLCPILSDSLCSFMPKSHSALHQYAGPLAPPSQRLCELMHATEAVTSVVYCLVSRSSL